MLKIKLNRTVVAVTGANGYVGNIICKALAENCKVVRLLRSPVHQDDIAWEFGTDPIQIASLLKSKNVTHLIHVAWDMTLNNETLLRKICLDGTESLYVSSNTAGIKNIIFISTISAFDGAKSTYGRVKRSAEQITERFGGATLRLGLVYGEGNGGMFESLSKTVAKGGVIPLIGTGRQVQYLLHEACLVTLIRRTINCELNPGFLPITVADPESIQFRTLLKKIAKYNNKKIILVPIPWFFIYTLLKIIEFIGVKINFRSDSILSFIYQNPNPNFDLLEKLNIETKKFLQ